MGKNKLVWKRLKNVSFDAPMKENLKTPNKFSIFISSGAVGETQNGIFRTADVFGKAR